jgi:hypothetical protein
MSLSNAGFKRLIRFADSTGHIHYGEVPVGVPDGVPSSTDLARLSVPIYTRYAPWDDDFHLTTKTETISSV